MANNSRRQNSLFPLVGFIIFLFCVTFSTNAQAQEDEEDVVDQELSRPTPSPSQDQTPSPIFSKKRPKDSWGETIRKNKERNSQLEENLEQLEEGSE